MRNRVEGKKINSWLIPLLFTVLLSIGFGLPVAEAFHFPWDQGHDTTNWNDPPEPGPCTGPNCDPCKSSGSPVYVPTGHFIWSETDIVLGGRPPINIIRSYNSNDPRDGIFGNGWTSNCDPVLNKVVSSTGAISYSLRIANGKRYEYKQQSDGSILPPAGRFDSVEKTTQGDIRLTSPSGASQKFNSSGQLAEWSDANGNTLTYQYNAAGSITKISSGARFLQLTYDSKGHVAAIQDHTGRSWQYAYDANANLISVTDPFGGIRKFEYQAYKGVGDGFTYYQLTKITDESGVIVTKVTYSGNRVASYTEGANTYSYNYNTSTKTVTKTDSTSRVRKYVYNADQVIIQETDPLNNTEKYEYDANGKLTKFTDKQNNAWTSTYDSQGRNLSVTSPLGRTSTLQYLGNSPKPHKIITPLGHASTIDYDTKLNPVAVTDAKGNQSTLVYDADGNVISTIDAKGSQTAFTYNAMELPTDITDAKGNTMTFAYDSLARKNSATDAEGRTTTYEYDRGDLLVKTTNALGHQITYNYDAAGRLLTLTDPVGNTTQYTYDSFGRLSKETRPDGSLSTYTYNAANLLTQVNRYDGKIVTFTYDAAERLITSNVGGNATNYAFSARGDLSQTSNSVATISYSYNSDGELTGENQAGVAITRQYNNDGARTQLSALGLTYTYNRDELNLLSSLVNGTNTFNFSYDANNVVVGIGLPNGLNETYSYDAIYNLAQVKTGATTLDYAHDRTGLITQKSHNGAATNYSYDSIIRLTQAGNQSYNYDDAGNNLNNGALYSALTNRLSQNADMTFTYDQAGNLTQKAKNDGSQKKNYTYNLRNQLIKVETLDQNNQITKTLDFKYDPLGRRFTKTINGSIQKYVYDGSDIIAILDSNGQIASSIVHSDSRVDAPLSITTNGNSYYYHRDHQGSIVSLTNNAGAVTESYSYNPYGVTTKTGGANTNNPYAYTGRELDDNDLYYYRARYYDPTLQRFISEDPIFFAAGDYNFYRYVFNDPVNQTDSSGMFLDTVLDIGFILYDLYKITKDNIINGCDNLGENLLALGADVAGALVPFASGGGMAVRGAKYADEAVDATRACAGGVCKAGSGMCFTKGTPVHTQKGIKPIEEVQVGDLVSSKDELTGEITWKPVTQLIRNRDKDILIITLVNSKGEQEVIGATPEHPFWIEGRGWVEASQLKKGQELSTLEGEVVTIKSNKKDLALHSTYNFEVADSHTYFVGNDGVFVHNACDITAPYKRPSGATTKAQRESVQGQPCVDCGAVTSRQVADHKTPLVKEYYESGTINTQNMRSPDAVQSQCPTCSAKQGADMSRYSRQQRTKLGL